GLVDSTGWSDTLVLPGDSTIHLGMVILLRDTASSEPYEMIDTTGIVAEIVTTEDGGITETTTAPDPDKVSDSGTGLIEDRVGTGKRLDVRVYPNPSFGSIRVDFFGGGSYNYEIFDHIGRLVMQGIVFSGSYVDLSTSAAGLYFMRIRDGHIQVSTFRVILSK